LLSAFRRFANLAGRFGGLLRQRFHFRSHDCEAASSLAGARCFDGRIQCEKVGLPGDIADEFDHVPDMGCRMRQPGNPVIRLFRLSYRFTRNPRRCLNLVTDLVNRCCHFFGRHRNGLHIGGRHLGRARYNRYQFLGSHCGRCQCSSRYFKLARRRGNRFNNFTNRTFEIIGELLHIGRPLLLTALFRQFLLAAQAISLDNTIPNPSYSREAAGRLASMM